MDATIAVSEPGVNVVLHKAIALAHGSKSASASWGPFQVGYSATIALSGGVATLENAPANKLDLQNLNVTGSVSASFSSLARAGTWRRFAVWPITSSTGTTRKAHTRQTDIALVAARPYIENSQPYRRVSSSFAGPATRSVRFRWL